MKWGYFNNHHNALVPSLEDVPIRGKFVADLRKVKSPTAGLRFHDLLHHAITELAESQASAQTIMAIAEHVSPRMLARYWHVRLEAKRSALDALSTLASKTLQQTTGSGKTESKDGGYDTTHDTNENGTGQLPAELLEKKW